MTPETRPRARLGWEHATQTATPFELTYRIRRRDGQYRLHRFRALPIRGPEGGIDGWIGTADDVEDVQAVDDESAVQRQITQLRAMLDVAQPAEGERFGFVAADHLAERVNRILGEASELAEPPHQAPGADEEPHGAVARLSTRDLAVWRLIAAGHTNVEIANILGVSLRSVEASRSRLRRSLGARSRADLVRLGLECGLVNPR